MTILCGASALAAGENGTSAPPASLQGPPATRAHDVPKPQAEAAALKADAVTIALEAAGAYPQDPLAYALLGSAYYNTGQSEPAAKHLRRCLELNPRQADAYEMLARIAYDQGRLDEATSMCQEALKQGLTTPDVLNLLGRSFMDAGKTEAAIRALQEAAALPKPTGETFYLLGQAQLQTRNFESAKASFLRASTLRPDHTQAFFGLYTACLRLGQNADAERYREQFQKLESADRRALRERSAEEDSLSGLPLVRRTVARTLFGAGQVHGAHTNAAKAIELTRKAALLDADSPIYRAALEAQLVRSKAPEEALRAFEELATEQPDNYLNYFFVARAQGRLQRWEQAERAYRKTQELQPGWAGGYRGLAEIYLRTPDKLPQARMMAQKAVELEPNAGNFYVLAMVFLNLNDRTNALQAIRRATELSPKDKRYQELLGQIERGLK